MQEIITFSDDELDSMLNHHGVYNLRTSDEKSLTFMSEKQYNRMHPKDPKCPYSDILRKNSDDCGLMEFCNGCEWWNDFIQR